MYYRVLQDELQFPDDKAMDQDTKSLIRGVSTIHYVDMDISQQTLIASATESCTEDERTSYQETPLFRHDVSITHRLCWMSSQSALQRMVACISQALHTYVYR
jgi:hypothetical protein